jgi:hypothetical protein
MKVETVRAREVLDAVVTHTPDGGGGWPDLATWRRVVPSFFVDACAPEQTPEETAAYLAWWRSLDAADRAAAQRDLAWTFEQWIGWMEPDERQWWWWDATSVLPTYSRVFVVVDGWPSAVGSLRWLLRACGAGAVEVADDLL